MNSKNTDELVRMSQDQTFLERYKELMFLQENPENIISKRAFNRELKEADAKIEKGLLLITHIEKMLEKCKSELDKRYQGLGDLPPTITREQDPIWIDINEGRIEYLEGLQKKLSFMLEYTEREQVV